MFYLFGHIDELGILKCARNPEIEAAWKDVHLKGQLLRQKVFLGLILVFSCS